MTRIPGRLLLKVAQFVFDDSVRSAVVTPTISDLQEEVRTAGDHPVRRLRAALRGYGAFWLLVLSSPIAFHAWPTRRLGEQEMVDRSHGTAFGLIVAIVVLSTWSVLGWWTLAAAGGGTAFAFVIHRWNHDHPTELVIPENHVWRAPEINQSRIRVDGNIAGLIYVVGSLMVAMIGLPVVRWFFLAALVLGIVSAVTLLAWHNAHPRSRNSILFART